MAHAERDTSNATPGADDAPATRVRRSFLPPRVRKAVAPTLIVTLCLLHGVAIWTALGGRAGLTNGWPLWRDDHPLYFHSALVTRAFLRDSYTTAGYDPSFMSGYAKSVVFPASSTLPELVIACVGGSHPEFAYKLYVLLSAAAVPWLIALACILWHIRHSSAVIAVSLVLLYVWTDFPINYVTFGMLPYFLGIPVGLVATATFTRYLMLGGLVNWLLAASLLSLAVLVHLTTAMVIAPAALLAYLVGWMRSDSIAPDALLEFDTTLSRSEPRSDRRWTRTRHLGVWLIPVFVLATNAFWWLPGVWLSTTKGPSDFAFNHPEGVLSRLTQIIGGSEAPIQTILLAVGLPGLAWMIRQHRTGGVALMGFCAAGLFWGYLAGGLRGLDFLQPGRHTYALYTGLALAGAAGLEELVRRLHAASHGTDRFHRWVMVGAALIALRMVGNPLFASIRSLGSVGEPFLSSRPSPRLLWVMEQLRRHIKPGERLLYEESGKDVPGIADPFHRGRFSGLLPHRLGIEVLGGPYLHASLTTNFTQFGEGRLFGRAGWYRILLEDLSKLDLGLAEKVFGWKDRVWLEQLRENGPALAPSVLARWKGLDIFLDKLRTLDPAQAERIFGQTGWDRDYFVRYARLYRPSAILCWSPDARWFCRNNADLIRILDDDGTLLIGRVIGFGGDTIRGQAKVEAGLGRIRVRDLSPGLDGSVVLRYHFVPCLTTRPPVACEPEYLEEDPVPFIRLRPPLGTRDVELELVLPGRR
jgi:hypothetical protein